MQALTCVTALKLGFSAWPEWHGGYHLWNFYHLTLGVPHLQGLAQLTELRLNAVGLPPDWRQLINLQRLSWNDLYHTETAFTEGTWKYELPPSGLLGGPLTALTALTELELHTPQEIGELAAHPLPRHGWKVKRAGTGLLARIHCLPTVGSLHIALPQMWSWWRRCRAFPLCTSPRTPSSQMRFSPGCQQCAQGAQALRSASEQRTPRAVPASLLLGGAQPPVPFGNLPRPALFAVHSFFPTILCPARRQGTHCMLCTALDVSKPQRESRRRGGARQRHAGLAHVATCSCLTSLRLSSVVLQWLDF